MFHGNSSLSEMLIPVPVLHSVKHEEQTCEEQRKKEQQWQQTAAAVTSSHLTRPATFNTHIGIKAPVTKEVLGDLREISHVTLYLGHQ